MDDEGSRAGPSRVRWSGLRSWWSVGVGRGRVSTSVDRSPGIEWVELVSATDGRTHLVVETEYGDALAVGAGRCVALCGAVVVLSALVTPPGALCRLCAGS